VKGVDRRFHPRADGVFLLELQGGLKNRSFFLFVEDATAPSRFVNLIQRAEEFGRDEPFDSRREGGR
jgi:hypothetical protein